MLSNILMFFFTIFTLNFFNLIINNEYKSMVFTILRGCLPYSNGWNILECKCTYGMYGVYSGWVVFGFQRTLEGLHGIVGFEPFIDCIQMFYSLHKMLMAWYFCGMGLYDAYNHWKCRYKWYCRVIHEYIASTKSSLILCMWTQGERIHRWESSTSWHYVT